MASFKKLGLSDSILKVLKELGFEKPTEIQEESIPQLLEKNTDFIGLAQTGTGKTAAFGLPLLERIDPDSKATQALVLAPTRELGQQIAEQLYTFSKYLDKVNVLAVYGGAPIQGQIKALKRPQQVIIATPGRLIDLIKRKAVKLGEVQYLVLDEADEMLNMGFKDELDEILSYTPDDKLTWLFSATMPQEIKRMVKKFMDQPIEVKVNTKNEVNVNITHQYISVKSRDKSDAMIRILDSDPDIRGVVFCRTRMDTQNLAEFLMRKNYRADALHGDMSQAQRDKVMKRFKSKSLQVLIATDVAARGIDVNDLTHVFHYTLPDQIEYYTHRSGRTARAGKKGVSISFIGGGDQYKIKALERRLGIDFTQFQIPSAADIVQLAADKWAQGVLDTNEGGKIDDEILEKVNLQFADLSKEELVAKVLLNQLQRLDIDSDRDLNDTVRQRSGGSGGSSGGRFRRERNDRGKGGYKGKKKFERSDRSDRSGGGGKKKHKSKSEGKSKDFKSRYKKKKKG